MADADMRRYWDERAGEDALYFVDTRQRYGDPDPERFWSEGERDLDALLAAVGAEVLPDECVVEVGCGVGRLTRLLARRAARVIAIDVSAAMLERAREENAGLDNVEWLLGDGRSLACVPDASADACVSWVVFQHVPDPAITLGYVREMGRVLRPGGWAAFQVSNDPSVHRAPGRVRALLGSLAGRGPRGQDHPAWVGSAVELEALRAAAADAGMDVERTAYEGTQYCVVLARKRP
jgi:SAM-dependent methyltransferase